MSEIKIIKGLATALVSDRQKRNKYVTNRVLKAFDLFICLKSLTSSGHIKNFPGQISHILEYCKISKATFYTRIKALEKMGYVTKTKKDLALCSWQKVAEDYALPGKDFHKINYDVSNKIQNVEYILKAIEIAENQQAQQSQVERKLVKTPEIQQAFEDYYRSKGKKVEYSPKALSELQKETFALGAADYDAIHLVNPDTNRCARTIKKQYNFHSVRNVAYMKRELARRDLAAIVEPSDPVCRYNEFKPAPVDKSKKEPSSIGAIMGLIITPGPDKAHRKGSKQGKFTTFYSRMSNARIWRLPDQIIVNPKILAKNG